MEMKTFEMEFARFIERFHEQIKEAFLEDALYKREILSHYHLAQAILEELADAVLKEFTVNIDRRTPVEAIADRYVRLGLRCFEDRLSFSEMVRVFILLKRHTWLFFQESNFAGQPFDVRSIVALNNRMALFFDRCIYYLLVGYEQALSEHSGELEDLYHAFLRKIRQDLGLSIYSPNATPVTTEDLGRPD